MPITDKTEIAAVSEHLPSPERSLINTAFFVIIPRLKISEQFNIYLVMLSLYNTTVIICMYNFQNFYRYSLQGVKNDIPLLRCHFSILHCFWGFNQINPVRAYKHIYRFIIHLIKHFYIIKERNCTHISILG